MTAAMQAYQVTELVGPAAMQWTQLPVPEPGDGVLIEIRAAGVCFPDLLQTYGTYQDRPPLPFTPGLEVAGTVVADGSGSGFAPGDPVTAAVPTGGYAEYAVAPATQVHRMPAGLDFAQGAASVINYQSAYLALVLRGRLAAGERVLVRGAAGGLGAACVQVATALGAQVTAVVSTQAKAALAEQAGAGEVIVGADDWWPQLKARPGGGQFQVVVDPVGGADLNDAMRALAPGGRLIVVGFASGAIPVLTANRVLLRNVDVVGSAWAAYVAADPTLASRLASAISDLVTQRGLRPLVGTRYPLADAPRALLDLEARAPAGKIVLEVPGARRVGSQP
jgi:NADPH:quinone reductase